MQVKDIKNQELREEAELFIRNMRLLADKLEANWAQDHIRAAAEWFSITGRSFGVLAEDRYWTDEVWTEDKKKLTQE